MIVRENIFRMGYLPARRNEPSGTPDGPRVLSLPFSTSIVLQLNVANEFQIGLLTANCDLTWAGFRPGDRGTFIVKQDDTGGRTINFVAPLFWVLVRNPSIADLQPIAAPSAVTRYAFQVHQVGNALTIADNLFMITEKSGIA